MKIFPTLIGLALLTLGAGCNAKTELQLGTEALQKKQTDEALLHLEKARRAQPNQPEIMNLHAAALIEKGEMEAAREELLACLKIAPDYASARFNFAVVEFELGHFETVVTTLKSLTEKWDGAQQADALALLGDAYSRLGKNPEATAVYVKLVNNDKFWRDRPEITNKLGVVYTRLGRYEDARHWFEMSLGKDSEFAPAYLNLARLHHFYLPNHAAAQPYYEKYLALIPKGSEHDQAQELLTTLEKELHPGAVGNPPPAKLSETIAQPEPISVVGTTVPPKEGTPVLTTTPPALITKAELPLKPTDPKVKHAQAEQLAKAAYVAWQKKDLDGAATGYQQALAADPNYALAQYSLGLIYYGRKEMEKAANAYEDALKSDSAYGAVRLSYAQLLIEQKNIAGARIQYQKFLELKPNDPQGPAIKKWLEKNPR